MTSAADFDVAGKNPLPTATDVAEAQAATGATRNALELSITADELADIVAALMTLGTEPSFQDKPDGPRLINLALKLTFGGLRV